MKISRFEMRIEPYLYGVFPKGSYHEFRFKVRAENYEHEYRAIVTPDDDESILDLMFEAAKRRLKEQFAEHKQGKASTEGVGE